MQQESLLQDLPGGRTLPTQRQGVLVFDACHVGVILRAVLEGIITPSFEDAISRIRNGSFDYVLLKPLDAMLLVSACKVEPWKALELLAGLGIFVHAFLELGRPPTPGAVALGVVMLLSGVVAMYSLWPM